MICTYSASCIAGGPGLYRLQAPCHLAVVLQHGGMLLSNIGICKAKQPSVLQGVQATLLYRLMLKLSKPVIRQMLTVSLPPSRTLSATSSMPSANMQVTLNVANKKLKLQTEFQTANKISNCNQNLFVTSTLFSIGQVNAMTALAC